MLEVRPIQVSDIPLILNYWFELNDENRLLAMGADPKKMPSKEQFGNMLIQQLKAPVKEKNAFCMIWLSNRQPIGHCNVNNIQYGLQAKMHLHLWPKENRQQGLGTLFVKLTIPHFFEFLKLKDLYCEPYSLNIAPSKTLEKVGFRFIKSYKTTPGSINFEQEVNQYLFTVDDLPYL